MLESQGWKFEDGRLVGPDGREEQETSAHGVPRGTKRPARKAGLDGVDDGEGMGNEGLSVDFLEK
jgi:hypothetical protein